MKRPLSPADREPPTRGAAERPLQPAETPGAKPEQKRPSYTLCGVCNVQLNSAAQAQVHCGGRAHQRRLRQLRLGQGPSEPGPASSTPSPLLGPLPLPAWLLQPSLDIKHLLAFHLHGAAPFSLFPNFSTMDPVQKAVISHTFGIPAPLKKRLCISCNICHLRLNSVNQAEAHYKGHKHARKLKAVEAAKSKQRPKRRAWDRAAVSPANGSEDPGASKAREPAASPIGPLHQPPLTPEPSICEPGQADLVDSTSSASCCPPPAPEPGREAPGSESVVTPAAVESSRSGEGGQEKGGLYCPTCKVTVNSTSQLQAHNTGARHRWMVEGQRGAPRRARGRAVSRRRAGQKAGRVSGVQGSRQSSQPPFHCGLCQLQVNSETQLKQHMSSRRHKDRLAGKPPKHPKPPSPHSMLQKQAALAVSVLKSKLALQKQLTRTLAAHLLPAAATSAICTMPGPLALRPAPASLFPAPVLGPALFRAAAGAMRPTPGPLVFAPY
ncbi:zinc finger protein 385C isoform X1 [Cavia porcellus]|uniref:zinc finger protein 385C isoform X1 n=1 Tax=Cavia porcellus TaxID=10141 RepID=UPI002FDF3E98